MTRTDDGSLSPRYRYDVVYQRGGSSGIRPSRPAWSPLGSGNQRLLEDEPPVLLDLRPQLGIVEEAASVGRAAGAGPFPCPAREPGRPGRSGASPSCSRACRRRCRTRRGDRRGARRSRRTTAGGLASEAADSATGHGPTVRPKSVSILRSTSRWRRISSGTSSTRSMSPVGRAVSPLIRVGIEPATWISIRS